MASGAASGRIEERTSAAERLLDEDAAEDRIFSDVLPAEVD
jgi:hypothetical protein